jgi:DNA-binding MarR family transcriptional regulator
MKHLLLMTETFRRAGITTMYRASLCIAVVSRPGITNTQLAALLQTSRDSIQVALRNLIKENLVHVTKIIDKETNRSKETKVFPTPYLKDIIAEITNLTTR